MKKYGIQFWMNVVWVFCTTIAILYFLVDYRIFKSDMDKTVTENTQALDKNTDAWMKQAELNGKIIQYISSDED